MTGLLVGLCCFATHVVASLVWLRLRRGPALVVRHALSAVGSHALVVVVAAFLAGPFSYWPAAALSGFLAVGWLFAFSAVYKSVSLRVLAELERTPGHALTLEVITDAYVRPEFESRVAVLVNMGCAEEVAAAYAPTPKGNETARRVESVRRACGIVGDGMYGHAANLDREGGGGIRGHPLPHGQGSPVITPPSP
jgi:hypothetical protein